MIGPASASILADNAIPLALEEQVKFPPLQCRIHASELLCLVGPHRMQLRAYLLMLAGINKPLHGTLTLFGQSIADLDQRTLQKLRIDIGYLSGIAPVLSVQSAIMNVMLPLLYHEHLSLQEASAKVITLLAEVGCDFDLMTYPTLLSSFQRLQLGLARALILDPHILILDVPFHNLGASERQKMGLLLSRYKNDRTVCMIGGLQYPLFLEQYADQIIFISDHKMLHFTNWKSFIVSDDPEIRNLLA